MVAQLQSRLLQRGANVNFLMQFVQLLLTLFFVSTGATIILFTSFASMRAAQTETRLYAHQHKLTMSETEDYYLLQGGRLLQLHWRSLSLVNPIKCFCFTSDLFLIAGRIRSSPETVSLMSGESPFSCLKPYTAQSFGTSNKQQIWRLTYREMC